MSRLIVSSARSPRFWITMVFFMLPLISTALLDSGADEGGSTLRPAEMLEWESSTWTPATKDATSDGTIIVRKIAYPRHTSETFTFVGDIAGAIGNGGTLTAIDLTTPATYSSTEIEPPGWDLRSIQCDNGHYSQGWTNTAIIDLAAAETVACTFYNQAQGSSPCRQDSGRWPFGPSYATDIDGNTVYLGSGAALLTVDVSTPSNPQQLGSSDFWAQVRGVANDGTYAFVVVGVGYDGTLHAIDVGNPSNPQEVGSVFVNEPKGLEVVGSYAYVASGFSGLTVVDVADPTQPQVIGSTPTAGSADDIVISGSLALLAAAWDGISVVDISNPAAPWEVDSLSLGSSARSIDVVGDHAYVGCDNGLHVVYVGPSGPIHEVGVLNTSGLWSISIEGNYAYAGGSWNLKVIDIQVPTFPSFVTEEYIPGFTSDIVIVPGQAFLASGTGGLQIVDITTPSSPAIAGSLTQPTAAEDAAVIGDFAYLSLGYEGGLQVLDISDPTSIHQTAYLEPPFYVNSVEPAGDFAYVSAGSLGLRVYDVSDPSTPTLIGGGDTSGWAVRTAVEGDYAYVADFSDGLQIFDVSNPSIPLALGSAPTPDTAYDIAVRGDHVFVAAGSAGLRVFDVTDRNAPMEIGSHVTPSSATALAQTGDLVLLTCGNNGVRFVDVSTPSNPVEISSYRTWMSAYDITIVGQNAYVSGSGNRLSTLDLADPTAPIEIARIAVSSGATAIASGRSRVLVPQNEIQLEIFEPCGLLMADDFETADLDYWSQVAGGP